MAGWTREGRRRRRRVFANNQSILANVLGQVGLSKVAGAVDFARILIVVGPVEAATRQLLLDEILGLFVQLLPRLVDELARVGLEYAYGQYGAHLGQDDEKRQNEEQFQ